jgi:hypothetical protein
MGSRQSERSDVARVTSHSQRSVRCGTDRKMIDVQDSSSARIFMIVIPFRTSCRRIELKNFISSR